MAVIQSLNLVFKASTNKATTAIKGLGGSIGNLGRKFGVTGAIISGVASFMSVRWFKSTASAIDQQAKFADRLDASFEALQNYQFSAGQAGVKTQALNVGIQRMTRRLGEVFVKGTGMAAATIEKLGLSMSDLQGMRADEQFAAIGKEIGKVENQSEKLALTFSLFDTEGAALVNLFDEMAQSGNDVATRLSDMGGTISELEADQVEAMNDSFAGLGSLLSFIGKTITVSLSTPIRNMTEDLIAFIDETNALEKVKVLFQGLGLVVSWVSGLVKMLANVTTIFIRTAKLGILGLLRPVSLLVRGLGIAAEAMGAISEETKNTLSEFDKMVSREFGTTIDDIGTDFSDIGDAIIGSTFETVEEKTKNIAGNLDAAKKNAKKITFGQVFDAKLVDVAAFAKGKLKTEEEKQTAELKKQTMELRKQTAIIQKPVPAIAAP